MSQETPETTLDFETEIVAVEEKIAHLEQISKEEANVYKLQAVKKYEEDKRQFEFEREMFQEHLQHIKTTETLRINLRKKMQNVESQKDINDCFDLSMQILQIIFGGEFV